MHLIGKSLVIRTRAATEGTAVRLSDFERVWPGNLSIKKDEVVWPFSSGRRCRAAADEGQAGIVETGPSSVPFASLWVHLLPTGEGPKRKSQNRKTETTIHP